MAIGTTNFPTSLDTLDTLIRPANNASTALSEAIDSSATTINVTSTANFSESGLIAIDNEQITYTGKTSTSFTGCSRGFDGTTAASHISGATVEDVIAAAYHKVLANALIATQTKLGAGNTANRAIVSDASGNYTPSAVTRDMNETWGNLGALSFNTATASTGAAARMIWNDTDGTLNLGMKGGNVTLQIGQEQLARVVNKTGSQLTESAYKAVRISTAAGQRIGVALAQANSEANSKDVIGIVTETIDDNAEGFVTVSGLVNEINTTGSLQGETWSDGDVLYLSPTIAGGLTKVKPSAPNHLVIMGYVAYAHANHGKIYVYHASSWELDELHDVAISSPANGQALIYESATGLWKNQAISATPAGTTKQYQYNNSGVLGGGSLTEESGFVQSTAKIRITDSGLNTSPSLQIGAANYGFYKTGVYVAAAVENATIMGWNGATGSTHINQGYQIVFGSSGLGSPDLGLIRHAAGVLRITNADGLSGRLLIGGSLSTSGGQAHVIAGSASVTGLRVDTADTPTAPALDVRINGTADTGIKVDASTTAGDTRFLLYDVTSGTIQRVVVGANDSGGTGYRMLRIANA